MVGVPPRRQNANTRSNSRRRVIAAGLAGAAVSVAAGVLIAAFTASAAPRELPPPPNNPGPARYAPATIDLPVRDTLPVGLDADPTDLSTRPSGQSDR